MCYGCSKEPSHREGFFSTHNICFGLEIKKNQLRTLIWGPECVAFHRLANEIVNQMGCLVVGASIGALPSG